MSRRNQAKRRQAYGRRQHEVRERRNPDAPEETDARDEAWSQWTSPELADDPRAPDDSSYGNYAR